MVITDRSSIVLYGPAGVDGVSVEIVLLGLIKFNK